MKYQYNQISPLKRIEIGITLLLCHSWGLITQLAKDNGVSRWFIYYACLFPVQDMIKNFSAISKNCLKEACGLSGLGDLSITEMILTLYLCGGGKSLQEISDCMCKLTGKAIGVRLVSGVIMRIGELLSDSDHGLKYRITLACDEVFIGGQPVLVTIDPISGRILQLRLADHRDGITWGVALLEIIGEDGEYVRKVVSDQGSGLLNGVMLVFGSGKHQADYFHLVRDLYQAMWRLEVKTYSKMRVVEELKKRIYNRKTGEFVEKHYLDWEKASLELDEMIGWVDTCEYLMKELQDILQIVDIKTGKLRQKSAVIEELDAILALLSEVKDDKMPAAIKFFRRYQTEFLIYFDEVEASASKLEKAIPNSELLKAMCMIWELTRKKITASGKYKKYLEDKITLWMQIAWTYLDDNKEEVQYTMYWNIVNEELSSIIRSSSLVENINQRLRRYFDASLDQVNQNHLNLIRFYLNHKVIKRGKRKGKSPEQSYFKDEEIEGDWLIALRKHLKVDIIN